MHRIAIISTHPIQYNAPWFALLAREPDMDLKVFYTWSQRQHDLTDRAFGKNVEWDVPLLEGYEYTFVENSAKDPGNHHFRGIICPSLIEEISAWEPASLLVMGWNFRAHLKAMRFFKNRIPVLFRGDSTLLDKSNPLKSMVRRSVLKWVNRHEDAALPVGSGNRDYFLAHGMKDEQLFLSPHAIDNKRFADINAQGFDQQARDWRKELGIGETDRVILFAGKLIPKKDPLLLLQAYLRIKKEYQERLKLIVVGDGHLDQDMKSISGGDPDILYLSFQNQSVMPVVYRLGDLFCLPSSGPGETWGLAVNEAMASGRPCLISDRAGCAADLGTYTGNMVFRWGDVNDLAEKLSAMPETMPETMPDQARFDNTGFLGTWNYRQLVEGVLTATEKTAISSCSDTEP